MVDSSKKFVLAEATRAGVAFQEETFRLRLHLDVGAREEFQHVESHDGLNSGYSMPLTTLLYCLSWVWLAWLQGKDRGEIDEVIERTLNRSLDLMSWCDNPNARSAHDYLLLVCAVISSSRDLRSKVMSACVKYDIKSKESQYYQCLCEMLKRGMADEGGNLSDVLEWYSIQPQEKFYTYTDKSIVRAFCDRKFAKLTQLVEKRVSKFEAGAVKAGYFKRTGDHDIELVVRKISRNHCWPWLDYCLFKLGNTEHTEVWQGSVWFPDGL